MGKSTYKYSFLYQSNDKTITELINYLEKVYKLKFITIFDTKSSISFRLPILKLDLFNKKEIMFEAPNIFNKIKLCGNCRFPAEFSDVEPSIPYPESIKKCKSCEEPIYELKNGEYIKLKNKIKIQNEI